MKRITIKCERTSSNPFMEEKPSRFGGFVPRMDHWRVTLRYDRHSMTLVFSMGEGHHGKEPTVEDVLDCLFSDACTIDNARSFEEWCSELGYDTDSRRAETIYKATGKSTEKLKHLLGDDFIEVQTRYADR